MEVNVPSLIVYSALFILTTHRTLTLLDFLLSDFLRALAITRDKLRGTGLTESGLSPAESRLIPILLLYFNFLMSRQTQGRSKMKT